MPESRSPERGRLPTRTPSGVWWMSTPLSRVANNAASRRGLDAV